MPCNLFNLTTGSVKFAQMFATASLFADGSLGKDPELTSDPRDISGARKKPYTVTHYGAQAGGDTATPYVAIQYRSNIDHFRVAPIRWTVEAIWGTLRNARCILGQSNWSVSPFGLFFHTMRKRERERADERTRHWRT